MERQLDLDFDAVPGVLRFPGHRSRPTGARSRIVDGGAIIPFPPESRTALVRSVAWELDRMGTEEAEQFWDRTISLLHQELMGQPVDAALRHLKSFRAAVQAELDGLGAGPQSGRPTGGAA
ncbi:DUF6074 family protein [Mesorhizobium sp. ES1-1]|uniref:DUF6074 family protein n=1 Tax=Mesorhizobium sp. ES1-1 TaxID=2876629 RepID=UPI001CC937A1|nr:DUF6074 family protein [Mesorhizobium sp. ES1-1]